MEVAVTIRMMCRAGLAALVVLSLAGCADDATGPDGLAPDSGLYAKGEGGNGGGGGGGGGGDGGKGGTYAELLVIFRDIDGVPIVIGPFVGEHGIEYCVQPVTDRRVPNPYRLLGDMEADEYLSTTFSEVDGRTVTLVPLFAHYPEFLPDPDDDDHGDGGGGGNGGKISPTHNPDDPDEGGEACDPLVIRLADGTTVNYAVYATEAELERLNLGRTQDDVLARHLSEVILFINTAVEVTLDAAGRFGFEWDDYDGEPALDAGPKLQAVRKELLNTGVLAVNNPSFNNPYFQLIAEYYGPAEDVVRDFNSWNTMELTAFALGGAASKFGTINVDIVAYHDRVLSLANTTTWAATLHHQNLGEWFIDYGEFRYNRAEAFPGCVTYLHPYDHEYVVVPYLEASVPVGGIWIPLFGSLPPNAVGGVLANIAGYAQMAEDARSVNYFTHMFSELYMPVVDPVGINTCAAQRAALENGDPPPVNQPPVALFTYDCVGLTCDFTDTSTDSDGTIAAWLWTFGEGLALDTLQDPSHTFAASGSYTVTLTVTDNEGATGLISQVVTVTTVAPPPGDGPIASFTYECNNTATCRFTDTSTGESISWSWVFQNGDPANSSAQNPATTFQTVGNHDVALTVTNAGGSHTVHQTVSCSTAGKLRCK
jgi:PKD repeat protein